MLILTRRVGETLHIGDNITVTVLGSQGDQVRLGITARTTSPSTAPRSTSRSATSVPCRRRSWSRPGTESTRRQR